jgi:acyl carrier protein
MDDIETAVVKIVEQEMVREGVRLEDKFSSLGADELDMLAIAMVLEDMYSIRVDDNAMKKIRRVRDLAEYIKGALR